MQHQRTKITALIKQRGVIQAAGRAQAARSHPASNSTRGLGDTLIGGSMESSSQFKTRLFKTTDAKNDCSYCQAKNKKNVCCSRLIVALLYSLVLHQNETSGFLPRPLPQKQSTRKPYYFYRLFFSACTSNVQPRQILMKPFWRRVHIDLNSKRFVMSSTFQEEPAAVHTILLIVRE